MGPRKEDHLFINVLVGGHAMKAMVDSGALMNAVSPRAVNQLQLPWKNKDRPFRVTNVEGKPLDHEDGTVDKETDELSLVVQNREEKESFDIVNIGRFDLILGRPWLRKWQPLIDWSSDQVSWEPARTPIKEGRVPRRPRRQRRSVTEKDRKATSQTNDMHQSAIALLLRVSEFAVLEGESDWRTKIPDRYHRFKKVFQKELDTGLPEHTQWDHEIPLKEGTHPKHFKVYSLNERQREALIEYLTDNLRKGYIRASTSPAGYPVLFVPKKNGKLRLVVDYRQLNDITIKNRYPLPLISDLRDRLQGSQWYTALDLKGAYHLVRMKEGEEWKTAFRTTQGLYEYLVMPMGLTNAPATFQAMINHVLREYLDLFVVAYLDDILIFSKTFEEHQQHVEQVLSALEKAKLLVEPEKCQFHVQRVDFLGYTIEPGRISMQEEKVQAIKDWPTPQNVTDVRAFVGYVNFYRRFIKGFGGVAAPLTNLTGGKREFEWKEEHQQAFEALKQAILKRPVLSEADPTKPYEVNVDASQWAIGGELGQRDNEGRFHPVAFFSKKLHGAELNYPIHDKELMAIVFAFREWKHYLTGATQQTIVFSDHKNLVHFTTTKELKGRQIRWAEELSEFNFVVKFRKGKENSQADALSRRSDHVEGQSRVQQRQLLEGNQEDGLRMMEREIATLITFQPTGEWRQKFLDAVRGDPLRQELEEKDGLLQYHDKTYIPETVRKEYVTEFHEHPTRGHPGVHRTLAGIRRTHDAPGLRKLVAKVIHECDTCQRNKADRHKPYGLLQTIPLPTAPWESVTWDFITKLPLSKEPLTGAQYDSILVIVCRLTKTAKFIPFKETATAADLAYTFDRNVVAEHGTPRQIISDRDKLFTSKFWQEWIKAISVKHKLSTARHPQTDGQTERTNQTLETYLRCYVNYKQDDWVEWLPYAQAAYNGSIHESIKQTPFFALYGYERPLELSLETSHDHSTRRIEDLSQLHEKLQQILKTTHTRHAEFANRHRMSGPSLEEGDKVYLRRKGITTKRPSEKLDHKKLGPFSIKKKIGEVNYELTLPPGMRIYPVFHVSQLEPAHEGARVHEEDEAEPDDKEWEVERILDDKMEAGRQWFYVKWKDYGHEDDTWEPIEHLKNAQEALQVYQASKSRTSPNPHQTSRLRPRRH
jgi:RNase H-like domain found in reverse transcriptase/Reverse transcriptase (RNA-dependent DNA polymerase)/Integrase zinc binding domain/Chromo (CHRromatin Organisation MOdifier) domain